MGAVSEDGTVVSRQSDHATVTVATPNPPGGSPKSAKKAAE
jgi:hypothetical protein